MTSRLILCAVVVIMFGVTFVSVQDPMGTDAPPLVGVATADEHHLYLPLLTSPGESVPPTLTPTPSPGPTSTPTPTPVPEWVFWETFDGDPPAPLPWHGAGWDVAVHSRDRSAWYELEAVNAAHGSECDPPPATHTVTAYEDMVYQCRNHLMTALNASSYGVVVLTPNQLVDFSQGEALIRFDVSTLDVSDRDWWSIWITPYDENIVLPTNDFYPDLGGEPRNSIHFELKPEHAICPAVYRDFQTVSPGPFAGTCRWWISYDDYLTPSAMVRSQFEIRLSRTSVQVGMPQFNLWWDDMQIDDLGWDQGIVQIAHYSYTPFKDGNGGPNTWHWDNVEIAPAIPFTIIHADKRYVESDSSSVNFEAPAPANAHLRFTAIGSAIEVSLDGGATWQSAQRQAQEDTGSDYFATYWTSVPEGTDSVNVRGQSWWGGAWHARNFSMWSPDVSP